MLSKRIAATFIVALLLTEPVWASVIVSFDPNPRTLGVGETGSVNIVATIPQSEAVIGWGLDYIFQTPAIVGQQGFSIGSNWDAVPGTPDGDGLAGLAHMPTGGGVWGNNIVLATIQLQGLAPGQTLLIASDSNPPDLTEGFAIDPALGGGFADVVYNDGLAIVPEPSVAGLLLLVALATCLRRRANEH